MANIEPWLKSLDFKEIREKDNRIKKYQLKIRDYIIVIDMINKKIIYPNLKEIGRETTINFSQEENFVVLEIIIKLLKQGYRAEQISIEKSYKLGRNEKSGNADITVDNNEGEPFLIIEAKTYGSEFEKEWKNTLEDGGQLFSYEKQENKAKVLVLYASHVVNEKIVSIYHAISLVDNEEYLVTLPKPYGYKNAKGGNDKFEIWRDIYQRDYITNAVLEENIEPFKIGKPKISVDDLKKIEHDEVQSKYNQFATILRKYNIGGRENAFDKLVNLFLAKIVDEEQNSHDLQFNWKGIAQDTYFNLVDRLQKLYQIGMQKFLNEEVSYVSKQDVEEAFRLKKDAAKDAVLEYFKKLKYYSNNDFTFLEVYNEKLFYQNSQVLVEIMKMLQDMRLKTKEQNQFLGDLFEGFLDSGVKQSEGQFFTPLPIVKFIVSSLPLKEINSQTDIPKIIDYACGSGHFLNEYAEQLKRYVKEEQLQEYYSEIYGIEKEYRLSKVAKVSAFMYGQDNIHVIYGDALSENELIKDNSYSVVIANPPYSVKGFLETLSEKERGKYILASEVESLDKNNSIELFFIEKTEQLLKSEGVAGIIVPSSVLSNGNIYSKARKLLIENFNIISIVEFGSKTFGSTGTNTVTLFLKKKKYPPKESNHYRYSVERWFDNDYKQNIEDIQKIDAEIVNNYCNLLGIEYESYKELQTGELKELYDLELFKEYIEEFSKTTKAKNINAKKITAKYTKEDKEKEYIKTQFEYIREIEKEKVIFFALANSQKEEVIIVKSPTNNDEMKKFLGYEWSNRKGSEGIKYLGSNISAEEMEISKNQAIDGINTPLFNPKDLDDSSKINTVIRNNFNRESKIIPENLKEYITKFSLIDMLDFSQTSFDAQIKTSPQKKIEITSKYPVMKLGDVVKINIGGTPSRKNSAYFQNGNNLWLSISEMNGQIIYETKEKITDEAVKNSNVKLIPKGTTLLSFKLSIGKTAISGTDLYTNEAIAGLIPKNVNELLDKYIYIYFNSKLINLENVGNKAFGKSLNKEFLEKEVPIPIPPIEIQKEIITEVEKLEEKYQNSRMKIEEYRKEIEKIFRDLDVILENIPSNVGGGVYKLGNVCNIISGGTPSTKEKKYYENGTIPWLKSEVCKGKIINNANTFITEDGFKNSNTKWLKKNTTLIALVGATKGKVGFLTFEATTNQNIAGIKVNDESKNNDKFIFYLLNNMYQEIIRDLSSYDMLTISSIKNISIKLPDINIQNEVINRITELEQNIKLEEEEILKIKEEINNILQERLK